MPRKLLPAALLIAALLLAPLSAQADLVDCTNCGRSLNPASCTYCPYCGVRVTNYLQITNVHQKRDGQVYLAWQDAGGHAPYVVFFRHYVSSDYSSSAQQKEILWRDSDAENTYQTNVLLDYLAPGYDYWIEVRDSQKTACRYQYSAPEVYSFNDFSASLAVKCRRKNGSDYTDLSAFSASSLATDPSSCGLYLRLEFPALSRTATYGCMVAIIDPTGSPIVTTKLHDVTIESGWVNFGWDFYALDWYFSHVKEQHGSILTGQYIVRYYLNGQLAGSGSFTVQ